MPSVAQIDGLNIPGGAPAIPAPAAAYSVRLLDSALGVPTYTGAAMRVRRVTGTNNAGNDDEADVGFDSNNVLSLDSPVSNFSVGGSNATTLGQFLNVGTVNSITYTDADSLSPNTAAAYVDGWKDQSGNGNDAEQGTPSAQPQIHAGTVDTDLILENGKPSLSFDGSGDNLQYTGNFLGGSAATGVSVSSFDNATRTAREIMWGAQDLSGARYDFLITRQASNAGSGTTQNGIDLYVEGGFTLNNPNVGTITDTDQHLYTAIYSNTVRRIVYNNGTTLTTDAGVARGDLTDATAFVIGADISGGSNSIDGQIQEVVIWNADQEADGNRTAIEENINSEYLIYQPTDQPTSGLLYDYGSATGGTDAAAAYSVRQLSDKAVLCMRIRRDMGPGNPGDDDEINIGFDANGDLDTQAISDFCGTGTGWVTRWWDQSVNGNHADRDVPDSQPQIYNGTAVITEGSLGYEKPIITSTINAILNYPLGNNPQQVYGVFKATQAQTNQAILGSSNDAYLLLMTTQGSSSELRFSRTLTRIDQSTYTGTTRNDARLAFQNQCVLYCDYTTTATNGDMRFGFDVNFVMSDIQEVIIYPDTATHTVADVEDAINSYFNIY